MSTTRIKEKISSIVRSQLPEFIQADYTTFVEFIEAYYRFLEQDKGAFELLQNASSYGDIDLTTEDFIKYFLKNYVTDFPLSTIANKKILIKRIKDLYESKGSEISLKYIFNLLFNAEVEISYPYENVLIASGGNWSQRYSLHVETVVGNKDNLNSRFLQYTDNNITYSTPITEVRPFNETVTEIFLDRNFLAPRYAVGDQVIVDDGSNVIFTGNIVPTITSVTIGSPGLGFKIGQIYSIFREGGRGSVVKVTNVTSTGQITEMKLIAYGAGYNSPTFSTNLDRTKTTTESIEQYFDSTGGFISTGAVYKFDPTDTSNHYFSLDYLDANSYTFTSIEALFANNTSVNAAATVSVSNTNAVITLTEGALGVYPGTYLTNDGFISELDVRLEDDMQYQPFAYLTTTTIDYADFFDIIKQVLHPAGQRLFNNRILRSNIDLAANVTVNTIPSLSLTAADSFEIVDQFSILTGENPTDEILQVAEVVNQSFSKNVSNAASSVDTSSIRLNKTNVDLIGVNSIASLNIEPVYSDNTNLTDSLTSLSIQTVYTDSVSLSDSMSIQFNQSIQDSSITVNEAVISINIEP